MQFSGIKIPTKSVYGNWLWAEYRFRFWSSIRPKLSIDIYSLLQKLHPFFVVLIRFSVNWRQSLFEWLRGLKARKGLIPVVSNIHRFVTVCVFGLKSFSNSSASFVKQFSFTYFFIGSGTIIFSELFTKSTSNIILINLKNFWHAFFLLSCT